MLLIDIFMFFGIIVVVIFGILVGLKKDLDLFGVFCLVVVIVFGGGIICDIMIGNLFFVVFVKFIYFFVSVLLVLFICMFFECINKF